MLSKPLLTNPQTSLTRLRTVIAVSSETWVDERTKKEVMLVRDLIERREKSEVTYFTEEAARKALDLYDDDIVVVTSEYEKGKGFEVQDVVLVEDAIQDIHHKTTAKADED